MYVHTYLCMYRVIPAHRNWQIETAVWNMAGFLHCALETRWQRFGQFLNDFLNDYMKNQNDFLYDFLYDFLNDSYNLLLQS